MENRPVRVRFAPSPTGPLHIGGVRTALYNYLFARKHGGVNILRIEDTDQTRYVAGAEQYIIEALQWCGISFDEGVHTGGPYGPYRQSERKELYRPYAEKLVKEGKAYFAFDSAEELDGKRRGSGEEGRKGEVFQYDSGTRMEMKNSLTLPEDEVRRRLDAGEPYVIRIKIPSGDQVRLTDLIRGEVTVDTNTLDDKVLFKSDGMPTYHLANVVDDHLMEVTHVIRGEEWLPSAPMHVLLYRFLGWEDSMPAFAHLPLLLKPDGAGKLSKRDGDRLGFPVFPLNWTDPKTMEISSGYKEAGFLPSAFINFLAFLGWNPGTEQELFSMEELSEVFSLERVSKSGAKFDYEKGKWFNQQYIKELDDAFLGALLLSELEKHHIPAEKDIILRVCSLLKERIVLLTDIWEAARPFFLDPESYDPETVEKKFKPGANEILTKYAEVLSTQDFADATTLESAFHRFLESNGLGTGAVMFPLRYVVTGRSGGPGMFDTMAILGKETTLRRIRAFLAEHYR